MSAQFYDGGKQSRTYRFPAAAIDTAAIFGRFQGPAGLVGRVRGIEYNLTVATTVAASVLTVDTVAGLASPITCPVPVQAINLGGATTAAILKAGTDLPADTICTVESDGGATAGDGDVVVTVDWY